MSCDTFPGPNYLSPPGSWPEQTRCNYATNVNLPRYHSAIAFLRKKQPRCQCSLWMSRRSFWDPICLLYATTLPLLKKSDLQFVIQGTQKTSGRRFSGQMKQKISYFAIYVKCYVLASTPQITLNTTYQQWNMVVVASRCATFAPIIALCCCNVQNPSRQPDCVQQTYQWSIMLTGSIFVSIIN